MPVANDEDYVVVVGQGAGLFRFVAALSGRPADQTLRALQRFEDQRCHRPRERLGGTSKMGQREFRRLLIIGAMAVVRWTCRKPPCRIAEASHVLGMKDA